MRVAVELSYLDSSAAHRGLGRYANAVWEAQPLLTDVTLVPFSVPLHDGRFGEMRSVPARLRRLRSTRADLHHTLSPYLVGRLPSMPWVVSMLDLIPLLVSCHQRTGAKARLVHRWAARADAVLTLSEFSKQQIAQHLEIAPEKIVVAPLPPSRAFWFDENPSDESALKDGGPYALAVADCRSPDQRKRLQWLEEVAPALADVGGRLVVVGRETAERFRDVRGLDPAGPVDDAPLRALMGGARFLAFPSAYEGQGLPPLEAMRCGAPVVAMNNTSIPEVVGDGGVLVDEETPDWAANACRGAEHVRARARFVDACADLFGDTDRCKALSANAVKHAESFDQARFAHGLRSAYDLAMNGSR